MKRGRYMFAVTLVVAIVMIGAAARLASAADRNAVFVAALLAGGNTIIAHCLAAWGARRSNKAFFTAVLVGTFVRMALVLAVVYFALASWGFPRVPFVATLLSLFALFLAFELKHQARALRGVTA